jgi:hypothetical protein
MRNGDVDWIHLAQGRVWRLALVNTAMKKLIPWTAKTWTFWHIVCLVNLLKQVFLYTSILLHVSRFCSHSVLCLSCMLHAYWRSFVWNNQYLIISPLLHKHWPYQGVKPISVGWTANCFPCPLLVLYLTYNLYFLGRELLKCAHKKDFVSFGLYFYLICKNSWWVD